MGLSIYWLLLLSALLFFGISSCYEGNGDLSRFLERRLREVKTELEKIVLDANGFLVRRAKRDSQRPVITFDKLFENNTKIDGEIYHFDNILVLNSENIRGIDKQHLHHMNILCEECLGVDFRRVTFVQVKKHSNTMFIVIGMNDGFLNLFSTQLSDLKHHHHHHQKYDLLQRIPSSRGSAIYPVDGKFFTESGHLFLYVIYTSANGDTSESILLRLRNAYLDKEYTNIRTYGAKSVATFSFERSQIIVIAETAAKKVSSQVLKFSHSKRKLERVQLLETKRPRSVTHFRAFENNFVFVCEESPPSTIYWWHGGEFLKWLDIPFMFDSCSFSIKQVQDQTLFINIMKNEATIYSLGWKHIREIVPVPRPINDDQKIINLFISTENITRLNIVGIAPKSIRFSMWDLTITSPISTVGEGKPAAVEDPLTECLAKAEGNLGAIAKRINETNELANKHLIQLDKDLRFDTVKVLGEKCSVRINSGSADRLDLSYADGKSSTDNDIDELLAKSSDFIQSSIIDQVHVRFASNLTIKNANLKLASAARVNDRELTSKDFIWLEGGQELESLNITDIKTDQLQNNDLGGKQIDEFILKSTLDDVETLFLGSLNCKDIHSNNKRINEINLEQLVLKNHTDTIHGKKYFKLVEVGELQGIGAKQQQQINKQSYSQEEAVDDPFKGNSLELEANTIIDNLIVQHINGKDVDELMKSIALNNEASSIDSALTFLNDMRVDLLKGYRIQPTNSSSQSTNTQESSSILSKRQFSSGSEEEEDAEDECVIEQEEVDDFGETSQRSRSIIQSGFPRYNFGKDIHVKGNMKVNELICKNCKVVVQSQSFPISNLEEIFWTHGTKQNITVPTTINSSITANEAIEATFINGQKLDCILDNSNDRIFKPKFIFKNVTVLSDIIDSSDMSHDGLKAKQLSDSIVRSSDTQYIKDKKNFNGGVSVNYLKAENFGQRSPPELSSRSMRKSTEEDATDDRPHRFVVDGDLIVREDLDVIYFNNIEIESKMKLAAYKDQDFDLERIEFKNLEVDNIDIGLLNGDSPEIALKSPQPQAKIQKAELHILDNSEPLHLLDVNYINDIKIHELLPKVANMTDKTIIIRDKKIFESPTIITNNLNTEEINDIRITDMYEDALSRTKEQIIKQPTRVLHHSSIKSLNSEKMNGIEASQLIDVSSNESIILNCDLLFKKLTVLGNVTIADSCDRSKENSNKDVNNRKHFQNMHVIGNVSWNEGDNNIGKISTMLKKAVTVDKRQTITGSVIFNKDLTIKQVQHANGKSIRNINLTHIMKDSLMKNKINQVVMGEKIFLNCVLCNSMTLTGDLLADHINQEDILHFNKTLVRKHSTDIVEGHKYFENGFNSFSLKTAGGVNGISMNDIILTNSNRVLPETVFEDLEIVRNLDTKTYNDVDLNEFLKERFLISKGTHQVFNGSITFKNSVIFEGESLVGTLNNVSIDSIVLKKGNSPVPVNQIDDCKTFNAPMKIEGVINTERLNYQDLHKLNQCSVLYDGPSNLKGNIVFENYVELDNELWAQAYSIEGIDVNLTNAIEKFRATTGYKLNNEV